MNLRVLLADHGRIIGFGFALALLSTFGQTTFISLSAPDIRASVRPLAWRIRRDLLDRHPCLRPPMIWVGGIHRPGQRPPICKVALSGLCVAALGLSLCTESPWPRTRALRPSRLCGQGMLSHAAVTSTARLPDGTQGSCRRHRHSRLPGGRGLSPGHRACPDRRARMGRPCGKLVAALLAACLAFGDRGRRRAPRCSTRRRSRLQFCTTEPEAPRRRDLLTNWRFLVFVPSIIAPSAILTAFVFHQRFIAEAKGWPLELVAGSITTYAAASLTMTFITGPLIDRFGALVLSPRFIFSASRPPASPSQPSRGRLRRAGSVRPARDDGRRQQHGHSGRAGRTVRNPASRSHPSACGGPVRGGLRDDARNGRAPVRSRDQPGPSCLASRPM